MEVRRHDKVMLAATGRFGGGCSMAQQKKTKAKPKPAKTPRGPFLAAAFFCDGILQDMGGVLSVSRIVDQLNISVHPDAPDDVPSKEKPLPVQQNLLVMFRTGS